MPVRQITVEYINHDTSGFSAPVQVSLGTTIGEFFSAQMPSKDARSYLILVNREQRRRDYELQEGDRVSVTPTKVQGA